ncbi:2-phospho-L-lactate guanylyltransferase [Pseudonocardia abyssalis]|uniref:Phosphoenolpyruvate guanylyltransferase n=1 Tax=Pseudonocardia abyssalis TaxID=2792008 RepID=A0ABS6UU52_9PSEU|nr:2-phospho-L-lactate guanylyltransferase [Pseudonocardia abyssalis]MBW0116881.1 2-phospho-L-lactate guanylyltransferase [Pseudonocardia abyssalis]MBW0135747.1 2-phospho-L-lactate guanylyltransferase [Pseudonocardia abyssalis]
MDLVVPVKRLAEAKTRLRGAAGDDPAAHARLTLALTHDTVAAARAARLVRRLIVVSSDPVVAAELAAVGVEVVPDGPLPGLNAAYAHGAEVLRSRRPDGPVGALQADLPALRPDELDAAIAASAGHARAFCADADGTGTTLLLAAEGVALDPRFGVGSAVGHAASGAVALTGAWPGLRRDVDTPDDLRAAADLGLGEHTRAVTVPCR